MAISGITLGKVIVGGLGLAAGGLVAFNTVGDGCMFGGCDAGAEATTVQASTEAVGDSCCPLSGEAEIVAAAAAGESCEYSCDSKGDVTQVAAAGESCEYSCDSKGAVTEVAAAGESCASSCEGKAEIVAAAAEGEACAASCDKADSQVVEADESIETEAVEAGEPVAEGPAVTEVASNG